MPETETSAPSAREEQETCAPRPRRFVRLDTARTVDAASCGNVVPGFACTRPVGHNGAHVAHDIARRPVAVWFDDEPASAPALDDDRERALRFFEWVAAAGVTVGERTDRLAAEFAAVRGETIAATTAAPAQVRIDIKPELAEALGAISDALDDVSHVVPRWTFGAREVSVVDRVKKLVELYRVEQHAPAPKFPVTFVTFDERANPIWHCVVCGGTGLYLRDPIKILHHKLPVPICTDCVGTDHEKYAHAVARVALLVAKHEGQQDPARRWLDGAPAVPTIDSIKPTDVVYLYCGPGVRTLSGSQVTSFDLQRATKVVVERAGRAHVVKNRKGALGEVEAPKADGGRGPECGGCTEQPAPAAEPRKGDDGGIDELVGPPGAVDGDEFPEDRSDRRDAFAAAAVTGLLAHMDCTPEDAAELAFRVADAMLAARGSR